MMFRGIQQINLDAKHRLAIPTRYRQALSDDCGGKLIITIDTEQPCLLIYPIPVWVEIEEKLAGLPSFNSAARRIQRLLIGYATEVEMDNSGRVLIPPPLCDYAGLEKATALLGQGNKFELWNEKSWEDSRDAWLRDPLLDGDDLPADLKSLSI
jgi:MraZ protein